MPPGHSPGRGRYSSRPRTEPAVQLALLGKLPWVGGGVIEKLPDARASGCRHRVRPRIVGRAETRKAAPVGYRVAAEQFRTRSVFIFTALV
jgi:hypothetical protein